MEKNTYAAAYETFLGKGIKFPSKKKKIDYHDIIDYCPTITKEGLNWLSFLNTTKFTADRIENDTTLLP